MSAARNHRIEAALAALERANLRKTPQRVAIVEAFADDPSHPTANAIFLRLREQLPTVSFATVYNTLAALERAGSCRVLRIAGPAGDAGARFDPNVTPHDHAICDGCGAVRDVPCEEAEGRATRTIPFFEVVRVERVFHGSCDSCCARSAGALGASGALDPTRRL